MKHMFGAFGAWNCGASLIYLAQHEYRTAFVCLLGMMVCALFYGKLPK